MVAVASKRLLIICPEIDSAPQSLGVLLYERLLEANVPVLAPGAGEFNWLDNKEIANYFAIHRPHTVVCAFPQGAELYQWYRDNTARRRLEMIAANVASACAEYDAATLFLSDYHVFGGETKSSYSETDSPAPLDDYGEFLVSLEKCFSERITRHLILRFSWLVDHRGDNLFTRILACLAEGDTLALSRHRRGAPTWQTDALRILYGVTRQVLAGAENWGYFHYCSADNANEWEFGKEVRATLGDYQTPEGELVVDSDGDSLQPPLEPASATLSCRRIRNNFGVHGRSWRQGLAFNVLAWLEARKGPPEAGDVPHSAPATGTQSP